MRQIWLAIGLAAALFAHGSVDRPDPAAAASRAPQAIEFAVDCLAS